MAKENKCEITFQVTVPEFKEPEKFKQGRKKFLERLQREIEPARSELGYDPNMLATDKLIWQVKNRDRVRKWMLEICAKLLLTDDEKIVNLLVTIFYEGVEAIPQISGIISPYIRDAFPLFFVAVGLPPEIDKLEPQERGFLTNDLLIEGEIPGLSRDSLEQIFKKKGDYVIRGNLGLFHADAFREVGKWLKDIKSKIDAGKVFDIKVGRPQGYMPARKKVLGNMTWDEVIHRICQDSKEANRLENQYLSERTRKFEQRYKRKHGCSPPSDQVVNERKKAMRYFNKQLKRIQPES